MSPRRASALSAARAPVTALYACALVTAVLSFEHPLALLALGIAILAAGVLAGAGRELARAALFGIPFALAIALINPLVAREGLNVVLRLGDAGPLGRLDITRESLLFGAIIGLRALLIVLAGGALIAATVNADELLSRLRRVSSRSALTAALAVRLLPVLGRDARALADARRCRPDATPKPSAGERLQIVRAVTTGALDRALDVAATLEVRGYANHQVARVRRRDRIREPWSRHDQAVAASALALLVLAAAARIFGVAEFDAYPTTDMPTGPDEWALAVALIAVALAPFANRRGVVR